MAVFLGAQGHFNAAISDPFASDDDERLLMLNPKS